MKKRHVASTLVHTIGIVILLAICTVVAFAADQTPPTYHAEIWPKLAALAQQAQQHGAIPDDANGQPITDMKSLTKRYQGRYASPTGIYKVFEHGGQLRIKREGDLSKVLRQQEDGQFAPWRLMRGRIPVQYNETKKVRYAFMALDGREILIVHENGAIRWAAEKVGRAEIPDAWTKRVGKYAITDLPDDAPIRAEITIRREFDLLWLTGTMISGEKVIAPLMPVTETEYRIGGLSNWAGGSFCVSVMDGQEALQFGVYKLEKK